MRNIRFTVFLAELKQSSIEFPDLIKYYTTIGISTLLKEEYTTIKERTPLKDIEHFMYLSQSYFSDNTPNQILHIMSTLLLWLK